MTAYRTMGSPAASDESVELRDFARKVGAGPRWLWTPGKQVPLTKRACLAFLVVKLGLALALHWWTLAIIVGVKATMVALFWKQPR